MASILVILLCSCLCGLAYCSHKYNNPNKLIFIFGKKGSGKSTYMVYLMLKHLRKGWNVYTNMDDVNIPGVRIFSTEQLKTCVPEPHSVLFIDEGGLIWDNRGFKSFDKGYTEFFKLQRKYKCKVYINSQDFDIDKKIRTLTDSMVLMSSIAGCIGVVRPILRKVALVEASSQGESRIADNLRFGSLFSFRFLWLPSYFRYFDSYSAPCRPSVDFRSVPGDVTVLKEKSPLKALNKLSERSNK
ncbi:zonular occludens toxin [Inovirus sp.]|nr:zonular occludens toxin [Inovirus sp.]